MTAIEYQKWLIQKLERHIEIDRDSLASPSIPDYHADLLNRCIKEMEVTIMFLSAFCPLQMEKDLNPADPLKHSIIIKRI